MTPFERDGVYNSIPYRVLSDHSIEAMMPGGLVRFANMDQFVAESGSAFARTTETLSTRNDVNIPASARPLDYYSILMEAISTTKQNSAQLRALVYERARFNLKRDVLFGNSSMGLADVVRKINEFELAVARIEANATDDPLAITYRGSELGGDVPVRATSAIQILPPKPTPPLYASFKPVRRT